MKKVISLLLIIGFMCSACVNTDANLQRETARFLGNLRPDQVQVFDVDRGMTNVEWKAKTPKGNYNCYADDMVRRTSCVKIKR